MVIRRSFFAATLLLAGCAAPALQSGLAAQTPTVPQVHPAARANPAVWPAARSPSAITDPATEAQIAAILRKLTLEQKVGQMIQADISSITPADLERYPLGSILAGGNSGPYGDERANAAQWDKLVDEFRAASRKSGAGVPILFGILTTENIEQAVERAGTKAGNKGADAAMGALEMVNLMEQI